MNIDQMSREELVQELAALQEREKKKREDERLVHDLRVHQVELELQNRELRETQSALEESRNRYADLYDFAPTAYYTLDVRGCVQEVNLTGSTMVGRDRRHIIGLPFLALVRMEDPAPFWAHLRQCMETRAPVTSELAFSTAHAGVVQAQVVSAPVLDRWGRPAAVRTAFIDISERKKAELALGRALEAEHARRQWLEGLGTANLAITRALTTRTLSSLDAVQQTSVDQARLLVSAQFAALGVATEAGMPFEPWVFSGMDAPMVQAIGRYPKAMGILGALMEEGRAIRLKDLREHPRFSGFPPHHPTMTSFIGAPVRYGEQTLAHLYLTNKEGAAEFTEADLESVEMLAERVGIAMETARLSDATRAAVHSRDNLLAIVSHDLRSPLSAISLVSGLLLREPPASDRRRSRKQVDVIHRAADHMNRLISDLLEAATIEAGTFMVHPRMEDPRAIVDECLQLLEPSLASKLIRVECELPPALPSVCCDRARVVQVLSNLLGNAVKFTPERGLIRVSATHQNDVVCFAVADNGCGIAEPAIQHLFDRYWKGQSSGRHGIGLGLFIAKGIVDAHGGKMWVESQVNVGSTFFFTLHAAQRADEHATQP